ncbi:helix-turn-helix domain-containing protein [Prevotella sp. E2-28]|uniref:helix-turn-helix domain-containing protein n=1 Tax=Prevotella sp. E2-28 TaxID=2913620 RepID=UPI001EDC8DE6|nr:helix-turn-helix transcriptional regulator [Prevotella sp. E2-28]UKK54659.1 helix-turn-helix domain-containing protein [Prevotella sp. E2-28]
MKDRIRQIMESQHMTQQVFANAIGTTPATLSGIFNDRTRPTINIIESIKKKFPDISLEWLMFGQGDMYQQSPTPSGELTTAPEGPLSTPSSGMEEMFDFDPIPQNTNNRPQISHSAPIYNNSVKNTRPEIVREEVKIVDKPMRRVTEIRVYYDDQTWESFVPAKK